MMLEELGSAITRLESCSLSSSPACSILKWQHKRFLPVLSRIQACTFPRVRRILTEEAVENAGCILYLPIGKGRTVLLTETPAWEYYVKAVEKGLILDTEYRRYIKAKDFSDKLLERSYVDECDGPDYKSIRYKNALSDGDAPAWFQTEKAALWAEEIVTAYCFIVFSAIDFAAEHKRQAS